MKLLEILPYNLNWIFSFNKEAALIKKVLGSNCKNIHHVGSTSVPGLSAKPIIDIVLLFQNRFQTIEKLQSIDYSYKGELNIPFRFYFSKEGEVKIHLHAYEYCEDGENPEIKLNIMFRDYLRAHPTALVDYSQLKEKLLSEKASLSKKGYTLGKDPFIRGILKKAGFNEIRLMRCFHVYEWECYNRILEHHKVNNLESASGEGSHYSFVLYKGAEIRAAAYLEALDDQNIVMRFLGIDKLYPQKEYEDKMIHLLEKWANGQGKNYYPLPHFKV